MKVKKYLMALAITQSSGKVIYDNEFVSVPKLTSGILSGYINSARVKWNGEHAAIVFIRELEG